METKIATSINQSKKLIELGLSADTADMVWTYDFVVNDINGLNVISDNFKPEENDIPAWSLSALIELMPEHIVINNKVSNSLKMDKEEAGIGFCYFFGAIDKIDDIIICDMTPIDAAFEMVCYLLENKMIK